MFMQQIVFMIIMRQNIEFLFLHERNTKRKRKGTAERERRGLKEEYQDAVKLQISSQARDRVCV